MKTLLIFLTRIYQKLISPLLPRRCRFIPTCSEYFIEALQKKGLFKGMAFGMYRLLRCHPLCRGGYDPVEATDKNQVTG